MSDVLVPGHVNLNTPSGEVTMIVNGVIQLAPNTTYAVWIRNFAGYEGDYINTYPPLGYFALGYFTIDEFGYGSLHYNISGSDLPAGTRSIQVAVNYGTGTRISTTATRWRPPSIGRSPRRVFE